MGSSTGETMLFSEIVADDKRAQLATGFVLGLIMDNEPQLVAAFAGPDQTESPDRDQTYQNTRALVDKLAESYYGRIDKGDLVLAAEADPNAPAIKLGWAKYVPFTTSSPRSGSQEIRTYLQYLTDDGKRLLNEYFDVLGQPTEEDIKQAQIVRAHKAFRGLGIGRRMMTD